MQTIELIRLRLLMQAHTFDELAGWMRKHRPRILPDSIGRLIVVLRQQGRVRIVEGKWEACRPLLHLPHQAPRCQECFDPRHATCDCPVLREAIAQWFGSREESPIEAR